MILSAVAGPTDGSSSSSRSLALFRSIFAGAEAVLAL